MDDSGKLLIPTQYGAIESPNPHWVMGLVLEKATAEQYDYYSWFQNDTYFLISRVDIYSLSQEDCMRSFTRSEYLSSYAYGDQVVNVEDRSTGIVTSYNSKFEELGTVRSIYSDDFVTYDYNHYTYNQLSGIMDAEGNTLVDAQYAYIADVPGFFEDTRYLEAEIDAFHGLIDLEGNVLVPCIYQDILPCSVDKGDRYVNAGYVCILQEDKVGYVNTLGQVTLVPAIGKNVMGGYPNGASFTYEAMDGTTHIVAADGVESSISLKSVYAVNYSGGLLYTARDEDYNEHLLDWHGTELLPDSLYDDFTLSADGRYLFAETDDDTLEVYTVTYPTAADNSSPVVETTEAAWTCDCGQVLEAAFNFCPNCGASLKE